MELELAAHAHTIVSARMIFTMFSLGGSCMNEEEESPLGLFLLPPESQDQQLLQLILRS